MGFMRYFSIDNVLPTADGGLHAPSLEKQQEDQRRILSNIQLGMASAAKCILATLKQANLKKKDTLFIMFALFYLSIRYSFPMRH